ncbi:Oar protein [Labilithrix luteola]|uniref:Oar protein n=1 Tax=Labilithrix luteola TaxID=1391654 RepID=A0A0K1PV18_9BACT|nr:TonB-dependent receptor [Labilithrix luteola]AKU96979.1 Oar protein [Labilithrix luteola]
MLAQSQTADLFGEVVDASSGKAVASAIVVATSPTLQGEQTAITGKDGRYRISNVPPGTYAVTVTAPSYKHYTESDISILVGRSVKLRVSLLPAVLKGEEIKVSRPVASVIDQGSTTTGQTFTSDYMSRVATQRNFNDVVEATPGAQFDPYGVSFNGTSSPENSIYVDGVNTSDINTGTRTSSLPLEFLDQVEVKTGGYMPEYGNSTGAVVSAVSKVGGNQFHGSAFSYTTPFSGLQRSSGQFGESLSHTIRLNYREQVGAEVGGPIVRDYLWFHVGFAPTFEQYTLTQRVSARADDGSGRPLYDAHGRPVMSAIPGLDRQFKTYSRSYVFTSKLTFNPNENHRITLGFSGNPTTTSGVQASYFGPVTNGIQSAALMNGDPSAYDNRVTSGAYDAVLNYDAKLLDKRLLFNSVLGWHHATNSIVPNTAIGANANQIQWTGTESLGQFLPGAAPYCTPFTNPGAVDTNRCPVTNYFQGGAGMTDRQIQDRLSLRASLTALLGRHQLKVGTEIMRSSLSHRTAFTGGAIEQMVAGNTQIYDSARYGNGNSTAVGLANGGSSNNPYVLNDANNRFYDSASNTTHYWNLAGYIQDSWNILDNLTIQGGIRIDNQYLYGGEQYSRPGQSSNALAFTLKNLSPRIGVIYDPTNTGRAKMFASYGRFFHLMPLSTLDRAFPEQSQVLTYRAAGTCPSNQPLTCQALQRSYIRAEGESVMRSLTGQAVDQYEAGAEYQILKDLLGGIRYTASRAHSLIEDYSTNNGSTFGVGSIGSTPYTNTLVGPNAVTGLDYAYYFRNAARNYDAISVYLNKSLARRFIGNASYTVSFLRGVENGLFRSEDGELHPNNNNSFNSAALFPNVYGYLGADRRHQAKLDGAFLFEIRPNFLVTPNIRLRVSSGAPYSMMGADPNFGPAQAYILSRGEGGVTPWYFQADVGLKAEQVLQDRSRLSYGLTVLNLLNLQTATQTDEKYAQNSEYIRPIAGGTKNDVAYVKTTNQTPARLNANYGNATAFQLPIEVRFDVKYTF